MKRIKFVGLDVHAETISVAVAEQGGEIRSLGVVPNREESIRKLVKKLGPVEELWFCYEAGPTRSELSSLRSWAHAICRLPIRALIGRNPNRMGLFPLTIQIVVAG